MKMEEMEMNRGSLPRRALFLGLALLAAAACGSPKGEQRATGSCALAVEKLRQCVLAIDCARQTSTAHCLENQKRWAGADPKTAAGLLCSGPGDCACNEKGASDFAACALDPDTCACAAQKGTAPVTRKNPSRRPDELGNTWVLGARGFSCNEACELETLTFDLGLTTRRLSEASGCKAIFDLLVRVELQAARVVPVYRALDAQIGCWAEIEVSGGGESYALRHAVDAGHITPTAHGSDKNRLCGCN